MGLLEDALGYIASGLSVIPIRADGSKSPMVQWEPFKKRLPSEDEVGRFFAGKCGIALVCGEISGGIEVFDFDAEGAFDTWRSIVEEHSPGSLEPWPIVKTPKGYGRHVYVRRQHAMGGRKIARDALGSTLIETRGDRQYVLMPGCPPECHPTGNVYEQLEGMPIRELGSDGEGYFLDDEAYDIWVWAARSINGYVEEDKIIEKVESGLQAGTRPGDEFNQQASWEEILVPAGWKLMKTTGVVQFWQRPGKEERDRGHSATTGKCTSDTSGSLLYVFSSNAVPLHSERAYSKFSAFALLHFGGNYRDAAKVLVARGLGGSPPRAGEVETKLHDAFDEHRDALSQEEDRKPLFNSRKFESARANYPAFAKTWDRKRRDLESDRPDELDNRYLTSLLYWCVQLKFSEVEILQLLHDDSLARKKDFRVNITYLAGRLAFFLENPHVPDIEGIIELETEEIAPGDKLDADAIEKLTEQASKMCGVPILRWTKSEVGEGGIYKLHLRDERVVTVGSVENVTSSKKFDNRLYDDTQSRLPPSSRRPVNWEKLTRILGKILVIENPEYTRKRQTLEWVKDYVFKRQPFQQEGDENWKHAVAESHPFERDGCVWIHVGNFRHWLHSLYGESIKDSKIRDRLRSAGFENEQVHCWLGNKAHGKGYWKIEASDLTKERPPTEPVPTHCPF